MAASRFAGFPDIPIYGATSTIIPFSVLFQNVRLASKIAAAFNARGSATPSQ